MREAPRIRRTSSESSFLQSLASIHLEPRSKRHSLSNNIVGDKGGAQSVANQKGTARPAHVPLMEGTVSDVAQAMPENSSQDVQKDRPLRLPDEKKRIAMQGILKFLDIDKDKDKDLAHSSRRRVSFSHQTETPHRGMTNFDFILNSPPNSPPKDSPDASHVDFQGTINASMPSGPTALPAPSIKSSCKSPSPQPPSVSSCNNKNRDMSSMFRCSQRIALPFETTPTSRLSRPIRRCSMTEIDQIRRQKNGRRAASHTGMSPPSISFQRRGSAGANLDKPYQQTFPQGHCRFRKDYTLGETARSASHMFIESCPQKALDRASRLKNYDFAFVKRMDGSWTYAILAHRSFVKHGVDSSKEGSMLFVMNKEGSTKMIKKRHWAEFVRCVVDEDCVGQV